MKQFYFLFLMFICISIGAQSNITFSVDMTGQTFIQPYVSGSFNGWSGTSNPLTDMGGNIWGVTLPISDGEYEYKFTYDDWAGQDTFTQGDICTITNYGNTNRRLVVAGADQTLATAPFNSCAESATNPGPHSVTLNIDMNAYGGTLGTVYVNGENYNSQGFGNWCGACGNDLTNMGGGIWSVTLSLEEYAYQFKFTVDGWTDQEGFSPGDPQTSTDGTFTNRYIKVDRDKTINFVWNQPQQTLSLHNSSFKDDFKVFPNPTQSQWVLKANQNLTEVQLFDVTGKTVLSQKLSGQDAIIEASELRTGIYFAKIKSSLGSTTYRLIKN